MRFSRTSSWTCSTDSRSARTISRNWRSASIAIPERWAHLFDERNDAVRWLIARAIAAGRRLEKPVGICGQAPSDYPEFAEWLVRQGIDSISLNPDVAIATALRVAAGETAPAVQSRVQGSNLFSKEKSQ